MSKRSLFIVFVLLSVWRLFAQDRDLQAFAARDVSGTARYVAMGGAFASLGGDVSGVSDNPAGLGVFRRGEVSVTLDWQRNLAYSQIGREGVNRFRLPQVSWVLNWGNAERQNGVLFNSIMFQYQRLKTYNRRISVGGDSPFSQTDMMAHLTEGLTDADFQSGQEIWNNPNIGWLSVIGYDYGVIIPDTVHSGNRWLSILSEGEHVQNALTIIESGAVDEYTFGWGMNISNRLYLGLSAHLLTLSYTKQTTYAETFALGGDYKYQSTLSAGGIGVDFGMGIIVRPASWLRIGAAFQSPTWMAVREDDYISYSDVYSLVNSQSQIACQLPLQVVAGLGFQIGTKGLIAFEYDYRHTKGNSVADEHVLKVGAEYVLGGHCFFRLGYALRSTFGLQDFEYEPLNTATRCDTEWTIDNGRHHVSAGVGFRNRRWIAEMAYQYTVQNVQIYPHKYQTQPFDVRNDTHRIVLSLGWTYRK
ncbi:MAG: hypothetical protein NC038_03250 [Paludibacter sp.]|nr:hypothetical protein [Bacteroidales bacterium]MCM1069113.1 hypothetical protein [Prevotella sp.]MCM1353552.1 hypothetical protein [Bacteroides sp.]MCM1442713.1 hypothetical protein [Muribaculum sp.]MCM1481651.1 hypothetical protein [Paludibacter sp.]